MNWELADLIAPWLLMAVFALVFNHGAKIVSGHNPNNGEKL